MQKGRRMNRSRCALLGVVGLGVVSVHDGIHPGAHATLVVGVLTRSATGSRDSGATAAARGIAIGVSEAAMTARLFGDTVRAVYAEVAPAARLQTISSSFGALRPSAILVTSADLVDLAARYAVDSHAIFINTFSAQPS